MSVQVQPDWKPVKLDKRTEHERKPLKRRRHGKLEKADVIAKERWFRVVLASGECALGLGHVTPTNRLQAHHIIPRQAIRKYATGFGKSALRRLLWDPRNGIALCSRCHSRHTTAHERIPLSLITDEAQDFAAELDLTYILERQYKAAA